MFNVTIYTDGACSGNPGPGGYGAILECKGARKIVRGCIKFTTNNRMELTAVVEALKALTKPCNVTVYTDSQYLMNCLSHEESWLTDEKRPNKDLFIEYLSAKKIHTVKLVKVEGHSGDDMNEKCDKIAKEQSRKARHLLIERR